MQKLFFFILSIYLPPHIYAMENEKLNINIAFRNAVENANQNSSQKNFNEIKKYLELGADINYTTGILYGEVAIIDAVRFLNKDLFDFLLQNGADINSRDNNERTLLYLFIEYKRVYSRNIERFDFEVKELCNKGVSLENIDSHNSNAFHVAIQKKLSKNYINLFITNSRFDSYNKKIDEQLKTIIKTVLLTFNQLKPTLPKEIQFIIFSHLALNCLYDSFNKKLCQQLANNKNAKNPILTCTLNKVNCLEQILQSTNNQNKTALQILHDEHQNDLLYIQEVESLVDVEKLRKDRNDFVNGSTANDNLVVQIYEHSKKLLLEQ